MRKISVVIPTTLQRYDLLERALISVAKQNRPADYVVISCDATEADIVSARAKLQRPSLTAELHVIRNRQSAGLSRNLNAAFAHMADFCPASTIVALLDDDDYWSETYLDAVERQFEAGANLVAAPFVYANEDAAQKPKRLPPDTFVQDDYLIGNPGISNSTMSIEFDLLQKIGGWNADLASCTDRDACLRLIEASARYAVAEGATAYIDRRHGSSRLTDRGGAAKFDGLEAFYTRWRQAMTPKVYAASRARSFRLFGYDPGLGKPTEHRAPAKLRMPLVVSVISTCPALLERLLLSLDAQASPVFDVTVIALCNNPGAEWPLSGAQSLKIRYHEKPGSQAVLKIAEARNLLQEKTRDYLHSRQDAPPVWFLDEDFTVNQAAIDKLAQVVSAPCRPADAILGQYVGDSPNAALSGLLYELQDLAANLQWLQSLPATARLPDRAAQNAAWMAAYPDTYHYALSLNDKPRCIAWIEPVHPQETVQEARDRMFANLPRLTRGQSLFRPLRSFGDPAALEVGEETVHRGGTIVILNPDMLDVPFPVIAGPNGSLRRSDMMWALLASRSHGFKIRKSNIATHHGRKEGGIAELSVEKTIDELIGSCVFNGLERTFGRPANLTFAAALKKRARRTQEMLAQYFDDLDGALVALEEMGNCALRDLTAHLRRVVNDDFRNRLLEELNALEKPETAMQLEEQLNAYEMGEAGSGNACSLIRPRSRMRVSTHFDDAIQLIQLGDLAAVERPVIRLHSSCQFSETFGATDCDCAAQLDAALSEIEAVGCGAVLYLQQEGRGHGLAEKMRIVDKMQQTDLTTYEACDALGLAHDIRCYDHAAALLKRLGLSKLCLLTNNPTKAQALRQHGFDVTTKALRGITSFESRAYLASKNAHLHHGLLLAAAQLDALAHEVDEPVVIDSTHRRHGEMSNFAPYPVFDAGVIWPTSEHLYQSRKFASAALRESIRRAKTPAQAKEIAHAQNGQASADWEAVRLNEMYAVVKLKLTQNPEVKQSLLATEQREIVELSTSDTFWARTREGNGHNYLGKILMLLRHEMRAGG